MKFSFDQMNSCQACAILNGISGVTIMAASSLIFKIWIQIQIKIQIQIQRQIQLQTNSQLPRLRHPERDQRSDYNGSSTTYIFGMVSTFGEDDGHSHQSGHLKHHRCYLLLLDWRAKCHPSYGSYTRRQRRLSRNAHFVRLTFLAAIKREPCRIKINNNNTTANIMWWYIQKVANCVLSRPKKYPPGLKHAGQRCVDAFGPSAGALLTSRQQFYWEQQHHKSSSLWYEQPPWNNINIV